MGGISLFLRGVVAGSTPVEEVETILMEKTEMVEMGVRDVLREKWMEDLEFGLSIVGLEEVVKREESALEVEEEGTLGEAVEMVFMTPKGMGEAKVGNSQENE